MLLNDAGFAGTLDSQNGWIDEWIGSCVSRATHNSHPKQFRDAGFLTTQLSIHLSMRTMPTYLPTYLPTPQASSAPHPPRVTATTATCLS